ncbi:gag-pol polyprotein [Hordeum vulgare]|nr:gag-pol polyprotein [Hordeum vulgare]
MPGAAGWREAASSARSGDGAQHPVATTSVRGLHLRAPPLLLLAPFPPTPTAFPLSRASSSFVDPPSYADVVASSPHFASASPRSARVATFEYSYITVSDPETETEAVATSLIPRLGSTYRAGGAAVMDLFPMIVCLLPHFFECGGYRVHLGRGFFILLQKGLIIREGFLELLLDLTGPSLGPLTGRLGLFGDRSSFVSLQLCLVQFGFESFDGSISNYEVTSRHLRLWICGIFADKAPQDKLPKLKSATSRSYYDFNIDFEIPFYGTHDPKEYLKWEHNMDTNLKLLQVPSKDQVKCATRNFRDLVSTWWLHTHSKRFEMSWSEMKKATRQEFAPSTYIEHLQRQLENIIQGSKPLGEYFMEMKKALRRAGVVDPI